MEQSVNRNQMLQNLKSRTTPWDNLRQLGEELDLPELAELASSIALAGTEGATVRASLAATRKSQCRARSAPPARLKPYSTSRGVMKAIFFTSALEIRNSKNKI